MCCLFRAALLSSALLAELRPRRANTPAAPVIHDNGEYDDEDEGAARYTGHGAVREAGSIRRVIQAWLIRVCVRQAFCDSVLVANCIEDFRVWEKVWKDPLGQFFPPS